MTTVVVASTTEGLGLALDDLFAPYGGIEGVLPRTDGTVYVKPNGIHFTPHTHTAPVVLEAVLAYLRDHGYRRFAVMRRRAPSCGNATLTGGCSWSQSTTI
jgi:uncharacterized protein (DUF362 family)